MILFKTKTNENKKRIIFERIFFFLSIFSFTLTGSISSSQAQPSHAISMHGQPALPKDFTHFPYCNPDAPKGGTINYAWVGTFDSFNSFIVQGTAARGSTDALFGNLVFETVMIRSADEPFTFYPLLAKAIETDDIRSFVEFTFDERARFSDNMPVRAEDFIFTLKLLAEKARPQFATIYSKIKTMEKKGKNRVRITFKEPNRELPLIIAGMPVLAEHAINPETFDRSSLKPIIASGPYTIESFKAGESITFRRNPDYWGKDIPSMRGMFNFDRVRLTYFRNENTMFESFRKGLVDVFLENDSNRWKKEYDFAAVKEGKVIKKSIKNNMPAGMHGIVMNTRREPFNNLKFRRALTKSFDFEWMNRNLLDMAYQRTTSFFANSYLSSYKIPASVQEKALLVNFPDLIPQEILENGWIPNSSNGSGHDRKFLAAIIEGLSEAGYRMKDRKIIKPDGKPLRFEIMLRGGSGEEKIALAWKKTLEKTGVLLDIRSIDSAQFQQRMVNYNFDTFIMHYPASLTPGIEQVGRWGSRNRNKPGTFNFVGAQHPAIDFMIEKMLMARTTDELTSIARTYDRILLSEAYVIPLYFQPEIWLAHWARLVQPEHRSLRGIQLATWWMPSG